MKKLSILILTAVFSLTACTTNNIDKDQYGVRYTIADNQWLTLKLDPSNDDTITSIICVNNDDYNEKAESYITGSKEDDKNTTPVIFAYDKNEDNIYSEYVVINFDGNDLSSYQDLFDYIGITSEFKDGTLTLNELKDSKEFRYHKFFEEGTFESNISFTNDNQYDVN